MPIKPSLTNPSQSLTDRLLGRDSELANRVDLAKQKLRKEMPSEMAAANIQPSGLLGGLKDELAKKLIGGDGNEATTGPFSNITYRPEQLKGKSQVGVEDTLAHELTHVGQFQKMPFWKRFIPVKNATQEGLPEYSRKALRLQGWPEHLLDYRGSSTEMEAFGAEDQRKLRRGEGFPGYDIQLFPPRKNTGVDVAPRNIKALQAQKGTEPIRPMTRKNGKLQ